MNEAFQVLDRLFGMQFGARVFVAAERTAEALRGTVAAIVLCDIDAQASALTGKRPLQVGLVDLSLELPATRRAGAPKKMVPIRSDRYSETHIIMLIAVSYTHLRAHETRHDLV